MKTRLILTRDGSHTLYRPDLDELYHSRYGAVQEAKHIYINCGLKQILHPVIKIFEVGFGTGLNAILSLIEAEKTNQMIHYDSIEKYPLDHALIKKLNYRNFLPKEYHSLFLKMHYLKWDQTSRIGNMILTKISGDIQTHIFNNNYNLIYFDAFGPDKDPDIWSSDVFNKIYHAMETGGILITFSVKGDIRRKLEKLGFYTEKIPGPPGKKHILRAIK